MAAVTICSDFITGQNKQTNNEKPKTFRPNSQVKLIYLPKEGLAQLKF